MARGIHKSLYIILSLFIGLFIASSFFIRAKYSYFVYGDTPVLEKQQLGLFILVIVLMLAISAALYTISLKLNRFSRRIVIPAVLAVSFALQLAIIFLFPVCRRMILRRCLIWRWICYTAAIIRPLRRAGICICSRLTSQRYYT